MNRSIFIAAIAASSLAISACGPSGEDDVFAGSPLENSADTRSDQDAPPTTGAKAADVYVAEMSRIADAIESVDDDASAEQAAEVIAGAVMRLNTRMAAMEENMSISDAMAFVGSRREQIVEVTTRLSTSVTELQTEHPELTEKIAEVLEGLDDFNTVQ